MTEKKEFDLIVIGAGPGGYIAAIKAAQNGKKVALVDKADVGGTCLNVGCIPTKTLLAGALVLDKVKHAGDFGINIPSFSLDFAKMMQRKKGVIEKMRKGLEGLIQSNQITLFRGQAEFTAPHEIKVRGQDNLFLSSSKIIIATGSEPLDIPAFPCDHKVIFNSTSLLEITFIPKTLVIIGGGYIGCEFASLYAQLGSKVIIVEALSSIVSLQGKVVSDALSAAFKKQGIEVRTGVVVEGITTSGQTATVRLKDGSTLSCDAVLVSVGRKVVSSSLGLEKAGVLTTDRGSIIVDAQMETNVPGIYAIGDVTGKTMLAHVASHQGIVAATNAMGGFTQMHYAAIPAVIFTLPEIATVGMTLEEALAAGYTAGVGKFPFQVLGKAVASLEVEGFSQIVVDKKTGKILGAQVVGSEASVLIAELALAMNNELTIECLVDTVHAHPTLSEAWLEAGLMALGIPLHYPPKKG